jgi:2,3-bisphosphoglycerate-independent phosphoglycerate mutase
MVAFPSRDSDGAVGMLSLVALGVGPGVDISHMALKELMRQVE